jgi:hypothetical protein
MPSIMGNMKLINMQFSSIVHVGDTKQICPNNVSEAFSGAGSFNTGVSVSTNNSISTTNTNDNDISDSTMTYIGNQGVT